jgi:hypothetical protein
MFSQIEVAFPILNFLGGQEMPLFVIAFHIYFTLPTEDSEIQPITAMSILHEQVFVDCLFK